MGDNKPNRKTFLKGIGLATIAAMTLSRKNGDAPSGKKEESVTEQLPLVARKEPRAVVREGKLS